MTKSLKTLVKATALSVVTAVTAPVAKLNEAANDKVEKTLAN